MRERPALARAEHFVDAVQQREAAQLGMWTFLATEILFFGGLFLAYVVYRYLYPEGFAIGSRHTNLLYGTLNTAVLLTSSLTMALALRTAQTGHSRAAARHLMLTMLLAVGFLVVKGLEYHQDWAEQLVPGPAFRPDLPSRAELFFWLYWAMTGLHAIHVTVGVGLLGCMIVLTLRGRFSKQYNTPIELAGLYWHFVDLVWILLYPLLYLIDRHA